MAKLKDIEHEEFATRYVSGETVREIAANMKLHIRAAYRRWERPDIKKRVAELSGIKLKELGISGAFVIEELVEIAQTETQSQYRLKALELLGKHFGLFVEKVQDVTERGHDDWVKLMVHMKVSGDDLSFLE